jgi:hypothetical protein
MLQLLEDLIDVVGGELTKRMREANNTAARLAEMEARLLQKAEEASQLSNTVRAQSDKIFAQQKALSKAQEEVGITDD